LEGDPCDGATSSLCSGARLRLGRLLRAQQRERVRRIGVLMNAEENDPEYKAYLAAFVQQLRSLGWSEGQNLRLDARWNGGEDGLGPRRPSCCNFRPMRSW
jgi:hypothetical protein